MPSNIDLCTIADVRSFLSMVSGQQQNSAQAAEVSTTIALAITAGAGVVVAPLTMANIFVGSVLAIDTGSNRELVAVTATSSTTFTASFAKSHSAATPIPVVDQTDLIIGNMITSAGLYWIWETGRGDWTGSSMVSPFNQLVAYDQWYSGNGNPQLFLKRTPVASVQLLEVNGVTIQPSVSWSDGGYVIDDDGKSLVIRSGGGYRLGRRTAWGGGCFANGIKNIHVQYMAGYPSTPPDVIDACTEMVALNFQRRKYLDQVSDASPSTIGTITYSKAELSPRIVSIMDNYSRTALA